MARRKTEPTTQSQSPPLESHLPGVNGGKVPRCQRVKKDGTQCKAVAIHGRKFCRVHGGKSPALVGPLNPAWKGGVSSDKLRLGRWADKVPGQLKADYIEALRDPEILSLQDEIALVNTRIGEVLKTATAYIDPQELLTIVAALGSAMAAGDKGLMTAHFNALQTLASQHGNSERAWAYAMKLTDRRRSLVESEQRRLVQNNMFMAREQVQRYAATIVEIVTRHVHDRATLMAIGADVKTLMEMNRAETAQNVTKA